MVDATKLSPDDYIKVVVEMEYLIWCVKHCIITIDEYMEMSDCWLFPWIKQLSNG